MRRRRRNRTGLYLVMTVVLLFCGTLGIHGIALKSNCLTLEEKQAYMQTDEYVEYIARQKFGLVYDNEIIFKAK